MKRGLLIILIMILMASIASAEIVINGPENSVYNLGDNVDINGYVWQNESFDGFINTKIVCSNIEYPVKLFNINIPKDQQLNIPEDVGLPEIIIPPDLEGNCSIVVELLRGVDVFDSGKSDQFEVVKRLDAAFEIENENVQLGDKIKFQASLLKVNGGDVEGTANIYFKYDNSKYLISAVEIKNGKINFEYDSAGLKPGSYVVDVYAKDNSGNEFMFEDAIMFNIVNNLVVSANLNKERYKPGEVVRVSGTVDNAVNENVNVEISLGDLKETTKVVNGQFSKEFILPKDVKSGDNKLKIKVSDNFGNVGTETLELEVLAQPTKIDNVLNLDVFQPEDVLEVTPMLFDQAGDELSMSVLVEILNTKEDEVFSKTVKSNQKLIYRIPKYAMPGMWVLRTSVNDDVVQESVLTIASLQKVSAEIENNVLEIKNLGNTKVKDNFEIVAKGSKDTFKINKRKTLYPNSSIVLNLENELPSDVYDITVRLPNNEQEFFQDVQITNGKPIKSLNKFYVLLILLFILFILYMMFSNKKEKPKRTIPQTHKKKLMNVRKTLDEHKQKEHERIKTIKDFKETILQEIKKTEKKAEEALRSKKGEVKPTSEENNDFANMFG
ncbi:hypothetical protein D6777_03470 [Candidatus Woesearchaeota archaeon]|nr:MAG: hypothetical protein D6777_03470 [Candidatus Woesearchaeota archaeon]